MLGVPACSRCASWLRASAIDEHIHSHYPRCVINYISLHISTTNTTVQWNYTLKSHNSLVLSCWGLWHGRTEYGSTQKMTGMSCVCVCLTTIKMKYPHAITSSFIWKVPECFIPPVVTECQLSSGVNALKCLVVQTLELVLRVVDTVSDRQQRQSQREDNAKYKVCAWLLGHQTVDSLNNLPTNINHRQLHLVSLTALPDHTVHCSTTQHN